MGSIGFCGEDRGGTDSCGNGAYLEKAFLLSSKGKDERKWNRVPGKREIQVTGEFTVPQEDVRM